MNDEAKAKGCLKLLGNSGTPNKRSRGGGTGRREGVARGIWEC